MNAIATITWVLFSVAHHDVTTEQRLGQYQSSAQCAAAGQDVLRTTPRLDVFCVRAVNATV